MRLSTAPEIPSTFTRAAFPLGGIGTGNVSLGARGELRDWELQNRPNKGGGNPCTFFAISVAHEGGDRITRVLESRYTDRRDWSDGTNDNVEGLPRLHASTLRGEYPLAEIEFSDDTLPVRVVLSAFTPLIPLRSAESGIPAAVLRYTVTNPGAAPVSVSVAGSVSHFGGRARDGGYEARQTVVWRDDAGLSGLDFGVELDPAHLDYGTMSLLTRDADVSAMPEWPDGRARLFWDSFRDDGRLAPVSAQDAEPEFPAWFADADADNWRNMIVPKRRTGSLAITHAIAPGESRDFEFVLSWHFPNRVRGWDGDLLFFEQGIPRDLGVTRNHYATLWDDAWSAGTFLARNLERLEGQTRAFHDSLFASTVDRAVLEAVSATIATLRSTTCFRIEDGTFFGWEGSGDSRGSWGGTCTHVWSYAQTVAWLFPDLEREARRVEFRTETEEDGRQYFRTNQYFGGEAFAWPGAADGQLGTIIRLHREWRFSGDEDFLRELWPAARSSLDYVLRVWDTDGDGMLDAATHNTYDIEFDGPEALTNILLLAALRAAERMAAAMGDTPARERYAEIFAAGASRIDERLFNGEYYQQEIDDADSRWNQYGTGVLSDQLLGQFHAHVNGLGDLLPAEHLKSAITAVFEHNFRPDLRLVDNTSRAFAFDDEGGLLMGSWPHGGRPRHPTIFVDEVWTGTEYHVAAELAYSGLPEQALTIVRAARARHTGRDRNPWDDMEAGHHYARSMSAWGLLLAFSGVQYDGAAATLSFDPVEDGSYFFSTGTGWGLATIADDAIELRLDFGSLDLSSLALRGRPIAGPVSLVADETFTS